MNISITESARSRISSICKENGKIVRLKITSGGCQGFNKVWELCDVPDEDDQIFDIDHAGRLVIDRSSLEIIDGATIDYQSNFSGSFFSVEIPLASSQCGCGSSFSI